MKRGVTERHDATYDVAFSLRSRRHALASQSRAIRGTALRWLTPRRAVQGGTSVAMVLPMKPSLGFASSFLVLASGCSGVSPDPAEPGDAALDGRDSASGAEATAGDALDDSAGKSDGISDAADTEPVFAKGWTDIAATTFAARSLHRA